MYKCTGTGGCCCTKLMMSGLCCCLVYLHFFVIQSHTSVQCPSPGCSCHLCGPGWDTQGEHILGQEGSEGTWNRSGAALSIVAFGGQGTKSELPEGSIGCRCVCNRPGLQELGGLGVLHSWYHCSGIYLVFMFLLEGEMEWQGRDKAAVSL